MKPLEGLILVRLRGTRKNDKSFPSSRWREAVNTYLDGVWSQSNETAEGQLVFVDIGLSLQKKEYYIQYPAHIAVVDRPNFNRDQIHAVTSERQQLELGFAKFVRNDQKRMLVVEFPAIRLMLWKGEKRTDLFFTAMDRTF